MELTKEQLLKRQAELYNELYDIKGKLLNLEKETYSTKDTCLMSSFDAVDSYAKVIHCDNSKVTLLLVDVTENTISVTPMIYYDLINDWVTCSKEVFVKAYNNVLNKIIKAYNE